MECAEKVVVACYLLDEGIAGSDIADFVSFLETGCLREEPDALALCNAFRERPFEGVPSGVLGDIVRLMVAKMEMDEVRREFSLGLAELRDLERLVSHVPQNEVGARVAVRRVQDIIRLFRAGA
jgi:hypothetical protein